MLFGFGIRLVLSLYIFLWPQGVRRKWNIFFYLSTLSIAYAVIRIKSDVMTSSNEDKTFIWMLLAVLDILSLPQHQNTRHPYTHQLN